MKTTNAFTLIITALLLAPLSGLRAEPSGVTYTISEDEALAGPKAGNPEIEIARPAGGIGDATISVNADRVLCRVNPMVFGACFEDLNHEIYGGLYAQMIFGESFEEGPEKEFPPGWKVHDDYLNRPVWQGMWCHENGAIGMTGFRWYRFLWTKTNFSDGAVECEIMQPSFDPRRPSGVIFRASGREFRDSYL